jgi:hypothetical protein
MPASWMARARAHKPAVVVLSVLVLAGGVGVTTTAIGSGGSGETRGATVAGASSVGASSAAARAAGARAAAAGPPRPAVSSGATWLTGPAGKVLDTVTADVGAITADQRAGSSDAARREGTRLAGDAVAGLRGPMPPVDATLYRFALRNFQQAGVDTASGNFRAASDLLTQASLNVVTITAALNSTSQKDSPA